MDSPGIFSTQESAWLRATAAAVHPRIMYVLALHCPACLGDFTQQHTVCKPEHYTEAVRAHLNEVFSYGFCRTKFVSSEAFSQPNLSLCRSST